MRRNAAGLPLLALLTALTLGGCSGFSWNPLDWFSSGPRHPPAPLEPIANSVPVRTLWRASIGSADAYVFVPAVVDGSVFAAGSDGSVARFDEATGREVWRVDVHSRLSGGVGSDGVLVAVGSAEGEVIVLEATGEVRWRSRVSSEGRSAPLGVPARDTFAGGAEPGRNRRTRQVRVRRFSWRQARRAVPDERRTALGRNGLAPAWHDGARADERRDRAPLDR